MAEYQDDTGAARPERRQQRYLRDLFDDVVRQVEPFFREGGGLNGQRTDFWVARTIRDAHSELSHDEVQVLANAAMRYYQERKHLVA